MSVATTLNASGIAIIHRVGYGDPSHFSREYKRLFVLRPMRDVEHLRGDAAYNTASPLVTRPRQGAPVHLPD